MTTLTIPSTFQPGILASPVSTMGNPDKPTRLTNEALQVLESAISDVGYWRWWTHDGMSGIFQVEFGGVRLYNEPADRNASPRGVFALSFHDTRCVAALRRRLESDTPDNWFEMLAEDQWEPAILSYEQFSLTNGTELQRIAGEAQETRLVVGTKSDVDAVRPEDAFLAFWAGDVGLLVVAKEMYAVTDEAITSEQILEKSTRWWDYWSEYWDRRDSENPMPEDYACEVTMPLKKRGLFQVFKDFLRMAKQDK